MMGIKAGSRYYKNWVLLAVLVCLALPLGGTKGLAQEWYLWGFNGTYGTDLTVLDTCRVCHPFYPLYYTRNSFGSDFETIGNLTFNQALEAADSDGDGFSNIREINALTFPGDPASTPPILQSLSIDGPPSVNEGGTAAYEAWATWSDDSSAIVSADWTVSPETVAMIDASGLLTGLEVTSNQDVTVSATYTEAGLTRSASFAVTIVNAPEITVTPQNEAEGIAVNTEVTVATDGSTDIRSVVDPTTFTLTAADSSSVSTADEAGTCPDGGSVLVDNISYNDGSTAVTFTLACDLAYATPYIATIDRVFEGDTSVPNQTLNWTFTTEAWTPDTDGDGVPDGQDDLPNDDGTATPPSVSGTGKIVVELVNKYGNAGIALARVGGVSEAWSQFSRNGKPFGLDFPDGLVRYTLTGVTPGGNVTVAVSFPSGIPFGSKVFKVDESGFQEWTNGIINGNKVTVTLTDGGEGDSDGVVNGEIVDPLGVAIPTGTVGPTDVSGTVSAGGGCSVVGPDEEWPETFGSFGFIALVWLGLVLRRRKRGMGP